MKKRIWIAGLLVVVLAGGALVAKRRGAGAADAASAATTSATTAATAAATASATSAGTAQTPAKSGSGGAGAPSAAPTIEFNPNDLMVVAAGQIAQRIPLTGTLRPANQSLVKSKVAGEIVELAVREGMSVKQGQVIARIDPVEYEWRVKEKEAQLRAAEANLAQARRTMQNNQQLLEKNFISQSAFDNGRFALDGALGNRDAAVAQLTMARKSLRDSVVTAPLGGVVGERFAQVGEKVSPDNRIVSIIDLSRMEIEAPVPASDIGAVTIGQQVTLNVEGIDTPQVGKVIRINPGTQAGTRSVPVYLGLDNNDARIRVGLFAQGQLVVGARNGVIAIPENALRDAAGRNFVFVVEDGRLVERDVVTGLRDDSMQTANGSSGVVEIRSGLKPGDRIVAVNLGPLRAGSAVRIAERAGPKAAANN